MRVRRAFRPLVTELLEDRVVPSPATVQAPPLVLGQPVALPPLLQGNAQVQQAFSVFTQSYLQMVNTVLFAAGANGVVDPAANRAAFDAGVVQALDVLAGTLVNALGNVPLNSPEVAQVRDAIIGDGPNSLESELMALSTASIEQMVATGAVNSVPLQAISQSLQGLTGQTAGVSLAPIPQAIAASLQQPASLVHNAASAQSEAQALAAIRTAFGNFLTTYYTAVRNVLLAPGPDGTVDAAANRAEFHSQVAVALRAMINSIAADLGDSAQASAVSVELQARLIGDGTDTLESRLAALPTPTPPSAATVREFTLSSFRVVVQAFAVVSKDVSELLAPAAPAP